MAEELDDAVGNDLGEVAVCDCGGINLTIGPVTLHLAADEVEEFRELVDAGNELLAARHRREVKKSGEGKRKTQGTVH